MKFASKELLSAILLGASVGSQAQTQADPKLYAEIGYAATTFKVEDAADQFKAKPALLTGIVGYQIHPNVAVEGLLGLGAKSSEIKWNGAATGVNVKINNTMGVFVRPSVKVSDEVELFARLGYLRSKLTLSDAFGSVSDTDNGVAYGLGGNVYLYKTSYLQLNWTSYYNKDDVKINGLGVAYGMRF
jgi:hypothetical protein